MSDKSSPWWAWLILSPLVVAGVLLAFGIAGFLAVCILGAMREGMLLAGRLFGL